MDYRYKNVVGKNKNDGVFTGDGFMTKLSTSPTSDDPALAIKTDIGAFKDSILEQMSTADKTYAENWLANDKKHDEARKALHELNKAIWLVVVLAVFIILLVVVLGFTNILKEGKGEQSL
jgi:hypothetical protein